jgi:hypothetical protein
MVCFRYIIVNTLHKGDNKSDDDDDDDNGLRSGEVICLHPLQGHVMRIYNLSMLKTVQA